MTNSLVPIAAPVDPSHNYTGNAFEGGKYQQTKHLGLKEIAKLIRTDLKQFPGFKFSVRCQGYSGGRSLSVGVTRWPEGFKWWSDTYRHGDAPRGACPPEQMRAYYSEESEDGRAILEEIEKVCKQYAFDDCDGGIDYFNVHFYLHVNNYVRHPLEVR